MTSSCGRLLTVFGLSSSSSYPAISYSSNRYLKTNSNAKIPMKLEEVEVEMEAVEGTLISSVFGEDVEARGTVKRWSNCAEVAEAFSTPHF